MAASYADQVLRELLAESSTDCERQRIAEQLDALSLEE